MLNSQQYPLNLYIDDLNYLNSNNFLYTISNTEIHKSLYRKTTTENNPSVYLVHQTKLLGYCCESNEERITQNYIQSL